MIGAAQTFDGPARQALIPALVSKERLVDAFALVNPTRELAILIGPALAGVLIATIGAGAVYAFDAVTYAVLIVLLAMLHVPRVMAAPKTQSIWASIGEGFAYLRQRKLIWQLMSLDFAATFCIGYRVLLPTLARDVLGVGAAGYGILAAAPAAGAIVGSAVIYRLRAVQAKGAMMLGATVGYALAAILLGLAPTFGVAVVAAGALGVFDAITTTLAPRRRAARHARPPARAGDLGVSDGLARRTVARPGADGRARHRRLARRWRWPWAPRRRCCTPSGWA